MSDATDPSQKLLEDWWNEDPEMRYVEVLCGERYRVCVRLYEIDVEEAPEFQKKVAEGEAGTLLEAIRRAIASAKENT